MSLKIAENDLVELTWWDQYNSKEITEISVHTECDDGSGDVWLSVGELSLSIWAWQVLLNQLDSILKKDGLQKFINEYKKVDGEVVVLSNNSVQWTKATSPKVE